MAPILIEPLSEQAYELLRQLEALHILRVVPAVETPAPARRKWAGSLSAASADAWDKHLQEIRGEWERNI